MTETLVDTNIFLDILTDDPVWRVWSIRALNDAIRSDRPCVNAVIYAELSVHFDRAATLDLMLDDFRTEVRDIPRDALFLAGKAFQQYRRAGGTRTGVLPDFFIGAHAAISRLPLLTRDPRRYRSYFPTIELIAP